MRLRRILDATIGRRLLVRIWFHGLLLLVGVIVTVILGHELTSFEAERVMRSRPYHALAVGDRVLSLHTDRVALEREVHVARSETLLEMSVFDADGLLLASSVEPPLAAPTQVERRALTPTPRPVAWSSDRLVVGIFRDGRLAACAVVAKPSGPSVPWHVAGLVMAAVIVAFVFVAFPLTRSIARPLERLGTLARELGAGNLAVRANEERHDEIGTLATSFNTMAGQIQRLRTAERELLGDVSHELRTPLARMRVVLDLARGADRERVQRYLSEITTDLAELEQLIDDIIVAARLDADGQRWDAARPPLRKTFVVIDDLVETALQRFRERWPDRVLQYESSDNRFVVDADPSMLRRALDNLLDNARKYSDETTPIKVRVESHALGDRPGVRVEVIDQGVGIAPEDRERVFSAFFRADRSRTRASGGVGLGLALARRIVEAHDGAIGFDSELDHGSTFWFVLAGPDSET
jgi:two-component system OmpR family sensor kinase